ncbi:MFS transporter [Pedobacter panaciterrae]
MAVVSGAGLIGCLTILPAGKPPAADKKFYLPVIFKNYIYCIKHPAFINYAIVRAISNSAAFSFITASPFIFTQIYGLSKKQFGFVFSGFAIGIIATGILNTRLLKHFEVQKITKLAMMCQLVTGLIMIIVLYFNGPFAVLLALIFIFLAMLGLILPNTTSLYIGAIPSFSGSASALVGAVSYLSAFLITSILSILYNGTAYPMILMMYCCAVVAYLCLQHKHLER